MIKWAKKENQFIKTWYDHTRGVIILAYGSGIITNQQEYMLLNYLINIYLEKTAIE